MFICHNYCCAILDLYFATGRWINCNTDPLTGKVAILSINLIKILMMEQQNSSNADSGLNVIITGASKGLGKAIAERFSANGNRLFLCARNEATLQSARTELLRLHPDCEIHAIATDISRKENAISFGNYCLQYGVPSILVNNAGSQFKQRLPLNKDAAPKDDGGQAWPYFQYVFHCFTGRL
jgi:hypothetical protein